MKNNFEILAKFLEKFGDEVEGRELAELTPDVKAKLREFARGNLAAAEQGELVERLSQNPAWVSQLAAEVKSLRGDSDRN
jgi:hypothetical protein